MPTSHYPPSLLHLFSLPFIKYPLPPSSEHTGNMVDTFRRSSFIAQESSHSTGQRKSSSGGGNRRNETNDNDTNVNDLITIDEKPLNSDVHMGRGDESVISLNMPHHHHTTALNTNQKYQDSGGIPLSLFSTAVTTAVAEQIYEEGNMTMSDQLSAIKSSLGTLQ